jgi:hypothetical protein
MGRPTVGIECRAGISSIGSDSTKRGASVTLHMRATDGPAGITGRTVNAELIPSDIAFVLSTIATLPEYRQVWQAIADTANRLDVIARDGSPVERACVRLARQITRYPSGNRYGSRPVRRMK